LKENPKKKKENLLRLIFLDLLKVAFITMCYFYVSELYGAISTPYISSSGFNISFSLCLFLFTFFSVLAGNYLSLISGFIGELVYQLVFYEAFYWEWIIIVALYGFICGSYKYKPQKYQKHIKIVYTFLLLLIPSSIIMLVIPLVQIVYYSNPLTLPEIFISYGFKFLIESLISTIFIIPFLLFLYDTVLASQEREIYNILLTHHPLFAKDHTFYLELGRTKIYFCSRCSGLVIGAIFSLFITHIFELIYFQPFSPEISLIICIIFPLIALSDWGTQRLSLRKSSTKSRLITGILLGVAWRLLLYTEKYYILMLIIIAIYFGIMFFLIYLGNRKMIKQVSKDLDPLSEDEEEKDKSWLNRAYG
jgi:uncharacterized membrane protein